MFLSRKEIAELTDRTQRASQILVLRAMGIEHKVRPDGSIAVLRAHVETEFGLSDKDAAKREKQPDWSAI